MSLVETYLQETIRHLQNYPIEDFNKVVAILKEARANGNKIFLIGNGGSGSTASHFANDIIKNTIQEGQPRVRCIALTDNMPIIMAIANDWDYSRIFVEQLIPLAKPNDVLIGFSGSGDSANIIKAMEWAKENQVKVIALGGRDGGKMKSIADVSVIMSTNSMAQIEDAHLITNHMLFLSMICDTRPPLM
ncbi:MAG: hypothetical protein B6242_15730 [Anaerolineaceae bacterium 4572_78]|nr:MAG: hypothetical protein B6242_15730 [Anaerolineaceae bacterium 4572_78]